MAAPKVPFAALSPSGRYIALVESSDTGEALLVVDIDQHKKRVILHTGIEADKGKGKYRVVGRFASLAWKGDAQLLYSLRSEWDRLGEIAPAAAQGSQVTIDGDAYYLVDREGVKVTPIVLQFDNAARPVLLLDRLRDDPEHILGLARESRSRVTVRRISVRDLSNEVIEAGDESVLDYLVDRKGSLIGRIRKLGRSGSGWLLLEGRGAGEADWTKITELHPDDIAPLSDFELLSASERPGQFYVAAKPKTAADGDTASIRILDFKTRALGPILAQNPKFDMDDIVLDADGKLLAGCYREDVRRCDFADKGPAAVMKGLDRFFEGERNVMVSSISDDGVRWLLSVSGPDEPGSYYLFDRKNGRVDLVASRYPHLPIDALGRMRRYDYKARDGYALSGYVTEPPGLGATLPALIVMPHGGPEIRDQYGYGHWVQLLASRGYTVFQPNFRGSGGFGRAFAEAGYRQWGGVMQDDVTDGVRALIASGKVDPHRVCIVGASYGGYVALYAGATDPLYRCVVSVAGDADLVRSMEWEAASRRDNTQRFDYWLRSIGDPKADRARLEAKSPIRMAERFTAPVLLIHGDIDPVVWVEQSRKMEGALKRAGKSVRYVELPHAGHTDWSPATEQRILTELEGFLATNLALAPAAAPRAPEAKTAH